MQRSKVVAVLAIPLVFVIGSVAARAMMIAPAPIPFRVADADCVVIGKVTSLEEKLVKASRFANDKEKGEYRIAVVKIEEGFGSARGLTHIRVGFLPPPVNVGNPVTPGTGPVLIRPIRRYPSVQLEKDQEVCLFLKPHADGSFHVAPAYFDVIHKNKENADQFAKDVAEVKRCVKLLADSKAGLESKNTDDRFTTAGLLLHRYRTAKVFDGKQPRTEPIDAEQSKLILQALAAADWNNNPQRPFQMNPQGLFFSLGLTDKDGWVQPKDYKQVPQAAQAWLKENSGKYRIQRFVEPAKKTDK